MTKRYILPPWEEFRTVPAARKADFTEKTLTVEINGTLVSKHVYNAIREATAVEAEGKVAVVDGTVETIERVTISRELFEANVELLAAAKSFSASEETERLVGAARGEVEVKWMGSPAEVAAFEARKKWADVGGGEEKPVRGKAEWRECPRDSHACQCAEPNVCRPAPDRCQSCRCWEEKANGMGECLRFPSKATKYAHDWCGEWRAK